MKKKCIGEISPICIFKLQIGEFSPKVVDFYLFHGIILRRVPLRCHSYDIAKRPYSKWFHIFVYKIRWLKSGYNLIGCWCASQRIFLRWVKSKWLKVNDYRTLEIGFQTSVSFSQLANQSFWCANWLCSAVFRQMTSIFNLKILKIVKFCVMINLLEKVDHIVQNM